jgi:hypothetical protein
MPKDQAGFLKSKHGVREGKNIQGAEENKDRGRTEEGGPREEKQKGLPTPRVWGGGQRKRNGLNFFPGKKKNTHSVLIQ